MRNMFRFVLATIIILTLSSCVSVSAIYNPPDQNSLMSSYTKIVQKNFDETWDQLINFAAGTFFGIDNFEKESGLLTLSFGTSNPQEYITGGYWKADIQAGFRELHFEGDYVEYLTTYQNGSLTGKMNIVVKEVDDNSTKIVINARYVFTAYVIDQNGAEYSNSWMFNSGNCGEIAVSNRIEGTPPTRMLCPTYKAEKTILDAIN